MQHTTLYRFFDQDDRLLYVGIAGNPARRAHEHSKAKPWWSDVARSTMEHFATREEAAAAEVAAIVTEAPLHNVIHNVGAKPRTKTTGTVTLGNRNTYPRGRLDDGTYWWLEWYGGSYCALIVDWVFGIPPEVDEGEWTRRAALGAGAVLYAERDTRGVSITCRSLPCPPEWIEVTVAAMLGLTARVRRLTAEEAWRG